MKAEKVILGFFIFGFIYVACFLIVPLLIWGYTTTPIPTEADSEVVNGILTVSGIIFGFQFAFFKEPEGKARILWVVGLICQVLPFAWVGFLYVSDTMSYGYLTTNTLLSIYLNFAWILFFTVFFASWDWALHLK